MSLYENRWWESLFLSDFSGATLDSPTRNVSAERDFIVRTAGLKRSDHVFDQCCGTGTIMAAITPHVGRVTGIDSSSHCTETARKACPDATVLFADARQRSVEDADVVLCWNSSFGYATEYRGRWTDSGRELMHMAAASLKDGGRMLMSTMNLPFIMRNFRSVIEHAGVRRECEMDVVSGLMKQRWSTPERFVDTAVRVYAPHEIVGMAREFGLILDGSYGNLGGAPLGIDSPICILKFVRNR